MKPGIYGPDIVPPDRYHADHLGDTPTLSRSIAHLLVSRTPRHAWWNHPKLNPDYQPKTSGILDHGSAVHALLFEGKTPCVCDFADWRTNAAKDARDQARKDGMIPLLSKDAEIVTAMCQAIDQQLDQLNGVRPFVAGQPEQTILWQEPNGTVCRVRVDYLTDDRRHLFDLKTTTTADPQVWSRRRLWEDGLDVQCSLYRRGIRATTGIDPEWAYVVVENTPPYALSVISLTPDALELADHKVDKAIALWQQCLDADEWPGYPSQVCYAELPPWEAARFLEREALEEMGEEVVA
jgi:hypothetical protein